MSKQEEKEGKSLMSIMQMSPWSVTMASPPKMSRSKMLLPTP